jgi:hypothetical protein
MIATRLRAVRSCSLCLLNQPHHHCRGCGLLTEDEKCGICLREDKGLSVGIASWEPWLFLLQEIFNTKDRIPSLFR